MTTDVAAHIPKLTRGWRLRMVMEGSGLDQSAWAEYLGVNRNTITRWTHDKGPVARGHLVAIALRTGVPVEWIESGIRPDGGDPDGIPYTPRDSNPEPADLVPRVVHTIAARRAARLERRAA